MKKGSVTAFLACFLIYALLRYPQAMLAAGAESVTLWFNQVLPSLFPFMIACGLLLKCGAADAVGKQLQPLMKPLFGLPGVAAFPFFLGIFAGYPMGAKITAVLFEEKKISLEEAEHILTFSNNPGPLFLVGTVGAAFFGMPFWGYVFLLCCFLGSLATGISFRFVYRNACRTTPTAFLATKPMAITKALPLTVSDAIDTIAQIGGYVLLFGVLTEALEQTGLFLFLHRLLSPAVSPLFLQGLIGGILEMTNGAYFLSISGDSLFLCLLSTCALVAFGGLSILCQTFGILQHIPIRKNRYFCAKLCNSGFSGLFFFCLYPFFEKTAQKTVPVFLPITETVFPSFYLWGFSLFLLGATLFLLRHQQ